MSHNLTIIMPTAGRLTLPRALDSIRAAGLRPTDQLIVIMDGEQPATMVVLQEMGVKALPRFGPKTGDYGNSQRNFALDERLATGDFICWLDDDDLYMPHALTIIRAALAEQPTRPHLFRFRQLGGGLIWTERGKIARAHIGGHCIVAPNEPAKLGRWGPGYDGDFDFIESTLRLCAEPVWREEVIVQQNGAR